MKKLSSKINKISSFRQENRQKRVFQYKERRETFLKQLKTEVKKDDEDEDLLTDYDDEKEIKNVVGIKDSLLKALYDSSDEDEIPSLSTPSFEEEVKYQTPKVILFYN
jgi:hypothetical protein